MLHCFNEETRSKSNAKLHTAKYIEKVEYLHVTWRKYVRSSTIKYISNAVCSKALLRL